MRVPELFSRRRFALLSVLVVVGILLVILARGTSTPTADWLPSAAPPRGDGHWVRRWLDGYGLPLAFGIMLVGGTGIPVPANLLVLTLGAAAAEGQRSLAWIFVVVLVALVLGDVLGYCLGSWGGRRLVRRIAHLFGSDEQLPRAREAVQRRGWAAVFLTRWLISPLCSPCNWVCGSMGYPLRRFLVAGVLGEALFIAIYLALGVAFSDQIESIADRVGTAGLWLAGFGLAALLAWRFLRTTDRAPAA